MLVPKYSLSVYKHKTGAGSYYRIWDTFACYGPTILVQFYYISSFSFCLPFCGAALVNLLNTRRDPSPGHTCTRTLGLVFKTSKEERQNVVFIECYQMKAKMSSS